MTRTRVNTTLERTKTVLWVFVAIWTVVTVARFTTGLGATSGLTDVAPWGLWIAFDVMAGVALAAGGFVLAATVYIFGLTKYHAFARPAILTALLGYIAVAVGLLYDLGLPWHIWHPLVFPQHHSVLFEVAMCVMLYLTVLALEFSPAILEHPLFHRPLFRSLLKKIKAMTIPLVIAGIVLSTLHQSSLGSLFLIQPYRTHPLWYSPWIPWLFFISAIGLGLMMVTLESLVSAWLFGHRIRVDLLKGLGRIASIVLGLYVIIRLGDLWRRGVLMQAMDGSWQAGLFLFELAFSALVPAILLSIPRVRQSVPGLATCSIMTVLGIIGYRFNTCLVAFERPEGMSYWPTWLELAISAGIVAGAALVFIFFNENLRIIEHDEHDAEAHAPAPQTAVEPQRPQRGRHSLAFVIAAAAAIGCLPQQAIFGPVPQQTPVGQTRTVEALATVAPQPMRLDFHMSSFSGGVTEAPLGTPVRVMVIDGNRNWRFVPFRHEGHVERLGGDESCRLCHHQRMPFDQNSACYQCHRDMYENTDIFDHPLHVDRLGGSDACIVCHSKDFARKSRGNTLSCWQCHGDMVVKGSLVPTAEGGLVGFAPGYMDAMHGLCMKCHADYAKSAPEKYGAEFARCDVCHREFQDTDHRRLAPYVPMPTGHTPLKDLTKVPSAASGGETQQGPVKSP